MRKPRVCVLRSAGTNCDRETAFAFKKAGAEPELVHIKELVTGNNSLDNFQILAIPGGFSYGDDIAAGKILANELKFKIAEDLKRFIREGKLVIGICNGFQILVKSGFLPGGVELKQEASLIINDSGKFEDRWIYLLTKGNSKRKQRCVWAKNLPEIIYLPVAHGEGKFIVKDRETLGRLKNNGQVVFRYCDKKGALSGYPDNPNGSVDSIAGICDETGRVFGLMPHPERHIDFLQHPRGAIGPDRHRNGDGYFIIKNGVEYAKKRL